MPRLLEFCCGGFQGKRSQMCINLDTNVKGEKLASHEIGYVRLIEGWTLRQR
jgi:hypothetical protein